MKRPTKQTLLRLNGGGVFYLRTIYGPGAGVPHPKQAGVIIKEIERVAPPGVTYAIQVKDAGGWRDVDDGRDRAALAKVYLRDWKRSQWKTRFVAKHPLAAEPLEIRP